MNYCISDICSAVQPHRWAMGYLLARFCLTHWPLGDLDAILKLQFSILFYWLVSSHRLRIMPWDKWDLTDDKSILVQVMAWCHQAPSHYLSQCWPSSMSRYGVTRPQWVKKNKNIISYQYFTVYSFSFVTLTEFAASEPVPGFNDGTLMLAFMDLRQLLDLFLSWDWTTYLADYGKDTSRYLRVSPNTCIIMLEK